MPVGVEVVLDRGFADVEFVDSKLCGPALERLRVLGGLESVEKLTGGLRPVYRMPEGNAREAGLLDDGGYVAAEVYHVADDGTETKLVPDADGMVTLDGGEPPAGNPAPSTEYPEGEPSSEWKLVQLKVYAKTKGIDAHELRSKAEVLALINAAGDKRL